MGGIETVATIEETTVVVKETVVDVVTVSIPGSAINWKGEYSNSTTYEVNDAVSYLGSSYICILQSTGNLPTNTTFWNVLVTSSHTKSSTDELTNKTIDVANNTFVNAHSLDMKKIGNPQFSSMGGIQKTTHSAGLVTGGIITRNSDGTVAVASGDGLIREVDSELSELYSCEWAANSSVALTDNSINYIFVEFVDLLNDPVIAVALSKPTDQSTKILLGTAYRSGLEIHVTTSNSFTITNHIHNMIDRFQETQFFQHASGGALSETGTRNIAVSAGTFWEGLNKIVTIAQDASGSSPDDNHTFDYFYRDSPSGWITHEETIDSVAFTGSGLDDATSGGVFVGSHTLRIHVEIDGTGTPDTFKFSYKGNDGVATIETTGIAITGSSQVLIDGVTITFAATTGHTSGDAWDFDAFLSAQIDNTQYDNGSGSLQTLGNNRYGVHWVYIDVHGHIAVLFGRGNYTLSQSEDAQPPTDLPPEFEEHARLIGRIIIKKSASTFTIIENNYGDTFSGRLPTDHGDLFGNSDDDHLQYLPINGIRAMTNTLLMEDNIISRPELKDYSETKTSPSSSSETLTLDLENSNVFEVTLTENVTTTNFNNPPATGKAGSLTLILKQDGGAGHTFVFPASVDWAGGVAPTLTTSSNAVDVLEFLTTDAGTRWYGFLRGAAMA